MFIQITILDASDKDTMMVHIQEAITFLNNIDIDKIEAADYVSKNKDGSQKVRVEISKD
jgi:hypothetical protein